MIPRAWKICGLDLCVLTSKLEAIARQDMAGDAHRTQSMNLCVCVCVITICYTVLFILLFVLRAQSIGSANLDQIPPRSPRLSAATTPNYSPSAQGYYTYNTPPAVRVRKTSHAPVDILAPQAGNSSTLDPSTMMPPHAATPWKRKLSQTMKHLVVSPRFHRKRYDGSNVESPTSDSPIAASPQL